MPDLMSTPLLFAQDLTIARAWDVLSYKIITEGAGASVGA